MRYNIIIIMLFATCLCDAYKVKIRNHTDYDVEVIIDIVTGKDIKHIVKAHSRRDIDTSFWSWRGIRAKTMDGKRKGKQGNMDCGTEYPAKYFVYKRKDKELIYDLHCDYPQAGNPANAFFDIFLPSQGILRKDNPEALSSQKYKVPSSVPQFFDEPMKDTGKNLIIVSRLKEGMKY